MKKYFLLFIIAIIVSCSKNDPVNNSLLLKKVTSNEESYNETFTYENNQLIKGEMLKNKSEATYFNGQHNYNNGLYSKYQIGYLKEFFYYNHNNKIDSVIVDDRYRKAKYVFEYKTDTIVAKYSDNLYYGNDIENQKIIFIINGELINEIQYPYNPYTLQKDTLIIKYDINKNISEISIHNNSIIEKKFTYEDILNPYYIIHSEMNSNLNGTYFYDFIHYPPSRFLNLQNEMGITPNIIKENGVEYNVNENNLPILKSLGSLNLKYQY